MRPTDTADSGRTIDEEDQVYPDLLAGITPAHIRRLCEGSWSGGYNMTPEEVGKLTLDQALMLLADSKVLRSKGRRRTEKLSEPMAAMRMADKDGFIKAKTADGKVIKGKIAGKSLARQLREKEEQRLREENEKKRKKRK